MVGLTALVPSSSNAVALVQTKLEPRLAAAGACQVGALPAPVFVSTCPDVPPVPVIAEAGIVLLVKLAPDPLNPDA